MAVKVASRRSTEITSPIKGRHNDVLTRVSYRYMGRITLIKTAIRGREGVERVAVVNGDLSAGISVAADAANPSTPIMLMKVSDGGAITRAPLFADV